MFFYGCKELEDPEPDITTEEINNEESENDNIDTEEKDDSEDKYTEDDDSSIGKCLIHYCSDYGEVPQDVEVEKGTVLGEAYLPVISEEGLKFKGWHQYCYDDEPEVIEPGEFTVTRETFLYAYWTKETKVTFCSDYGEVPEPVTVEYNVKNKYPKVRFPKLEAEKSDKKFFEYFSYDAEGNENARILIDISGEKYIYLNPEKTEISLYANWVDAIIIHMQTATGEMEDIVLPEGTYPQDHTGGSYSFYYNSGKVNIDLSCIEKEGYKIDVFFKDSSYEDFYNDENGKGFTDDCYVYPRWKKSITITFVENNGTNPWSIERFEGWFIDYGFVAKKKEYYIYYTRPGMGTSGWAKALPVLEGKAFEGWYLNGSKVTRENKFSEDVTLEARYVDPYVASFVYLKNNEDGSKEIVELETALPQMEFEGEYYFYKTVHDYWRMYMPFMSDEDFFSIKNVSKKNDEGNAVTTVRKVIGIYTDEGLSDLCTENQKFSENKTFYVLFSEEVIDGEWAF